MTARCPASSRTTPHYIPKSQQGRQTLLTSLHSTLQITRHSQSRERERWCWDAPVPETSADSSGVRQRSDLPWRPGGGGFSEAVLGALRRHSAGEGPGGAQRPHRHLRSLSPPKGGSLSRFLNPGAGRRSPSQPPSPKPHF
ncbi:hypothetical protein MRX96_003804 [Rhipicephalus microplus]